MNKFVLLFFIVVCGNVMGQNSIKRNRGNNTTNTSATTSKRQSKVISYKAIDLGLPSGTKWADRNVDAKSPEAYGNLYPFGNPWCTMKKNTGWYDIDNIIGTEYDIAKTKMGGKWRTPSSKQLEELVNYCTFAKIQVKDAIVAKVVGPNGNYIFLPLGGAMYNFGRSQGGEFGIYESGDRSADGNVYELQLYLFSRVEIVHNAKPSGFGCSVRGVCK